MKRILVTGYTGFVGVHLTPYLMQQGFEVIGMGRHKTDDIAFKQYTYAEVKSIKDHDAVIHLAAKAHDLKNPGDTAAYFEVNTDLTARIFDEFLASGATDFIYLSSVKAAADTVDGTLLETVKPNPVTPYGISKLKAEEYLLRKKLPEGKRVFILRPCLIHGPGNKGNLKLLCRLIKKGIPYPLAAFKNKRSLLSIQNLLFVIGALLNDASVKSGIYNVADDEPLATTGIIDALGKGLKKKPLQLRVSTSFVKGIALVGDKLHLPFTTERLKKLTESYVVSNDKIKKAIGVSALPVSAHDGLLYTALNI